METADPKKDVERWLETFGETCSALRSDMKAEHERTRCQAEMVLTGLAGDLKVYVYERINAIGQQVTVLTAEHAGFVAVLDNQEIRLEALEPKPNKAT